MPHKILQFGPLEFRFNWLIALCVLASFSTLVRLGLWQMERAQEKIAEQTLFMEAGNLQATPITQVPVAGLEFDTMQHQNRRVVLQGSYLNENPVFMIYQTYNEQIGYEIVSPVKVTGQDLIVFVSRGWSGIADVDALAASLTPITNPVELQGQIFISNTTMASQSNNLQSIKWPLLIRYFNITELQPLFDSPTFPYIVRLAENQPGVMIRHWPAVTVDSGRNFSYALQWFSMAIALLAVSLILSSNILKLRNKSANS